MAFLWPASYGDSERVFVFLRPAYNRDSEGYFRIFKASLLWGNTAVAEITIGGWAKVIMWGGVVVLSSFFLLHGVI